MLRFWFWLVPKWAISRTIHIWQWSWPSFLVSGTSFVLGMYFHYLSSGRQAMIGEMQVWLDFGLKGAGTALIFVIIWNILRAPVYLLENEKTANKETISVSNEKIKSLRNQLLDHNNNRTTSGVLALLLSDGLELSRRRISEDQYQEWIDDKNKWSSSALKWIASRVSFEDAIDFQHLHIKIYENYVFSISEEHNKKLNELKVCTDKLHDIIRRYGNHWRVVRADERDKFQEIINRLSGEPKPIQQLQDIEEKTQR